jgi:hypothetical protein
MNIHDDHRWDLNEGDKDYLPAGDEAYEQKFEAWQTRDWPDWLAKHLTFPFTVTREEDEGDAYFAPGAAKAVKEALVANSRVWLYPVSAFHGKPEAGLIAVSREYLHHAVYTKIAGDQRGTVAGRASGRGNRGRAEPPQGPLRLCHARGIGSPSLGLTAEPDQAGEGEVGSLRGRGRVGTHLMPDGSSDATPVTSRLR